MTEAGEFGVGNLIVNQIPGRLDIIFAPVSHQTFQQVTPFTERTNPELVHIGPASIALGEILRLIQRRDIGFRDPYRIGFAPVLLRKVKDNLEANKTVLKYESLPISDDDTDIVWRINRSTPAKSFEGRINKVFNWQTSRLITQRIVIGQPTGNPLPFVNAGGTYFVRVELDINTIHSERLTLTPLKNWQEALSEVVAASIEIMAKER